MDRSGHAGTTRATKGVNWTSNGGFRATSSLCLGFPGTLILHTQTRLLQPPTTGIMSYSFRILLICY